MYMYMVHVSLFHKCLSDHFNTISKFFIFGVEPGNEAYVHKKLCSLIVQHGRYQALKVPG